jgi:glyceraldehyde 3-phosphate dehydrogenase
MLIPVLAESFGLRSALVTNVHAVSRQQGTQDADHHDLRMARAAGFNIVPQHPSAAAAFTRVMPRFEGLVKDYTLRVPLPIGSLNSIAAHVDRPVTVEQVNASVKRASEVGRLSPYLDFIDEPIVSSDIISNPASCVFDAGLTEVTDRQVQVVGWHDNEWGYANRLLDLTGYIGGIDENGGAVPTAQELLRV